jgi:hypothetical protein
MKECFKKLGCKELPKFTVVIAGKRHHIRFFPDAGKGDRNGNPLRLWSLDALIPSSSTSTSARTWLSRALRDPSITSVFLTRASGWLRSCSPSSLSTRTNTSAPRPRSLYTQPSTTPTWLPTAPALTSTTTRCHLVRRRPRRINNLPPALLLRMWRSLLSWPCRSKYTNPLTTSRYTDNKKC